MRALFTVLFVLITLSPASAQQDAFAGDARLAAKQTLRAGSVSLGELMEILKRDTGIEFAAEPSVQTDRVILYAHDRPLAETLRELAAFFRFEWKKEKVEGKDAYVLAETMASRLPEKPNYSPRTLRVADAIVEELGFAQKFRDMPAEEMERQIDELELAVGLARVDPRRRAELQRELEQLRTWEKQDAKITHRVLGGMKRDDIANLLLTGLRQRYYFQEPQGKPEERKLEESLAKEGRALIVRQQMERERRLPKTFPRHPFEASSIRSVDMVISPHRAPVPTLGLNFQAEIPGGSTGGQAAFLPRVLGGIPENRAPLPTPEEIAALPWLSGRFWKPGEAPRSRFDGSRASLRQICNVLSEKFSADIICEDLWNGSGWMVDLDAPTPADVIKAVKDAHEFQWSIRDRFVVLRSLYHDADRWEEHLAAGPKTVR